MWLCVSAWFLVRLMRGQKSVVYVVIETKLILEETCTWVKSVKIMCRSVEEFLLEAELYCGQVWLGATQYRHSKRWSTLSSQ